MNPVEVTRMGTEHEKHRALRTRAREGVDVRDLSAGWSDGELISRIRRGEHRAIAELFKRLRPLLRSEASGAGATDVDGTVDEVLDDVVIRLMEATLPAPGSLYGYSLIALRNRLQAEGRKGAQEREWIGASSDERSSGERVVDASCSLWLLRESEGEFFEAHVVAEDLRLFALELVDGLSEDDGRIVVWLGDFVPQREIAIRLGLSYNAARVRIIRLRRRLHAKALRMLREMLPGKQARIRAVIMNATLVTDVTRDALTAVQDRDDGTRGR